MRATPGAASERLPANVDKRLVPIRGGGASDAASDAATADALTRLQNRLAERLNARASGASGAKGKSWAKRSTRSGLGM